MSTTTQKLPQSQEKADPSPGPRSRVRESPLRAGPAGVRSVFGTAFPALDCRQAQMCPADGPAGDSPDGSMAGRNPAGGPRRVYRHRKTPPDYGQARTAHGAAPHNVAPRVSAVAKDHSHEKDHHHEGDDEREGEKVKIRVEEWGKP